MKYLPSLICALAACVPATAQTFTADGITYSIVNGNEAKIVTHSVANNDEMTDLVVPDEVVYQDRAYPVVAIDDAAFYFCSALERVTIGRNVRSISCEAFWRCCPVKRLVWKPEECEVTAIPTSAPRQPARVESDYFHGIGNLDVSALEQVEICDGVRRLPGDFVACSPIQSVHIPATVTEIGPEGFAYCAQLRTITVDPANAVFDSRGGCNAVINTAADELVMACGATRIPTTVNAIGRAAYYPCADLKSLIIPAWITHIDSYACVCLGQLEEIHCRIADPANVTLGSSAFQTYVMGEWFSGVPKSCKLFVPTGSSALYRRADQWKRFKTIIEETPYEGPEDVNGDGRVDIDDVNAVINALLAQ